MKKLKKPFPVNILGNFLFHVKVVRELGVWFECDFSFSRHVQNICMSCFAQIRDVQHLTGYLTCDAALMATNVLDGSLLDYCNSLFRSLTALDLCKLQKVQNSLARIATNTTKYSRITPFRKILHWLPIEHHSIFKTTLLVYKFLHSVYPKYFVPFLKCIHVVYNTHKSQADVVFLEVPHSATSVCKSFFRSIFASALLMMPQGYRMICPMMYIWPLLSIFSEKKVKTYLFAQAHPP